jgi:hypothetical protein
MALSAIIPDSETINRVIDAELNEGLACQICFSANAESAVTVGVRSLTTSRALDTACYPLHDEGPHQAQLLN